MARRLMKDSNIEWIGEIPDAWHIYRHKNIMHKIKTLCEIYSGEDIISLTMSGVIKRDLEAGGKMPTTFDGYQYVEPGDLLLCLFDVDVTPRCVGLVKNYGITSPAYSRFKMYKGFHNAYYDYLLRTIDDKKAFLHLAKNLRSSFTETEFGFLPTIAPPYEEQVRIADFLDKKVSEIDAVISKTKESIEEYKKLKQSVITEAVTKGLDPNAEMKQSGIEWIGKIPINWTINRIKNNFTVYSGATPKSDHPEYWDGDVNWITPADYKTEDVYVESGNRSISEEGYNSCGTTLVPIGSIVFSKRAPIGLVAITSQELCTNQGCLSCVPSINTNNKYYYYVLSVCQEQFSIYGTGTTFKEISYDNFINFKIPYPHITEQNRIAKYLDDKCSKYDSLISKKEQVITELEQYKKSLIYEYVTGKKEVE